MKRKEFINRWVEAVRAGRRKNFPTIRPSEEAVAVWDDQKTAAKIWRKYRLNRASEDQLARILDTDRIKQNDAAVLVVPDRPAIQWDGRTLYRIKDGKRVLVGRIERVGCSEFWVVYVKKTLRHQMDSEQHARQQLERYAE